MRRAGETTSSLPVFHRYLKQRGITVHGADGTERVLRYKYGSTALRRLIMDVYGFSWPRSSGAAEDLVERRSR